MPGNPNQLSAGQRDRTIAIEQCVDTVGASTQFPIEQWTTLYARVQAAYDDETGDESFGAHQVSGTQSVRWTIPYLEACDPELVDVVKQRRIVANGRIYDILAATPIGWRLGLELRARAKVG